MYIAVVSVSLAKWEQTRSWTRVSIISRRRTLSGHGLFPRGVAVFYGVCSRSGRFLMLVSGRWEHRTVCSLASWRNHAPLVEAALFGHGKMPTMLEHGVCRDFIVWYLDAAYCSMNRAHLSLLFLLSLSLSLSLSAFPQFLVHLSPGKHFPRFTLVCQIVVELFRAPCAPLFRRWNDRSRFASRVSRFIICSSSIGFSIFFFRL